MKYNIYYCYASIELHQRPYHPLFFFSFSLFKLFFSLFSKNSKKKTLFFSLLDHTCYYTFPNIFSFLFISLSPHYSILYCGAKDSENPGQFHIKLKAHAKEKEMSKDEQRRFELSGDMAEDNFVLSKPKSQKEKTTRHQGQFPRVTQGKAQVQRDSYGTIVEEQF